MSDQSDVGSELWWLIADEPEAQKLFLTWPVAYDEWDGDDEEELDELWADLSGIGDAQRVRYFKKLLFGNALLREDGTQSERVLQILQVSVASELNRLRPRTR